jgi:hypothetical protein
MVYAENTRSGTKGAKAIALDYGIGDRFAKAENGLFCGQVAA